MKFLIQKRKFLLSVMIIALGMLVCAVLPKVTAASKSGYASFNMNGSYSRTMFSSDVWGKSNFWDVEVHYDGSSSTAWLGSTPYNADSITHRDILQVTGIGSMSVGGSKSGPNISVSLSGHTATYSYSLQNQWYLDVVYNYELNGLLAAWNYRQRAEATVQLGNTFYSFGT